MAGFGAKVKLTVDRSTAAKAAFNSQISSLINQIKISDKFIVLQKDMDRVRKDMEVKLSNAPIAIKSIDCSEAVAKFRTDMQNVINSLSIKNGVSISGLVDPSGVGSISTQVNNISGAAAKGQQEVNRLNSQLLLLKDIMSSVASSYKTLLPGGVNAPFAGDQFDNIQNEYLAILGLMEDVKHAQGVTSKEEMDYLTKEALLLRKKISLIEETRRAHEKVAAAQKEANAEATRESKRAAAKAERNAEKAAARAAAKAKTENGSGYSQLVRVNNLLSTLRNNYANWTKARYGRTKEAYSELAEQIEHLEKLRDRIKESIDRSKSPDSKSPAKGLGNFDDHLNKIKASAAGAAAEIKNAGESTKSFSDHAGGLVKKFASWLTVSQIIMQVYRAMRAVVSSVSEIDASMTELKKVTDETEETYNKFLDNISVRAKNLGATVSDAVSATALFARLGYDLHDAANLAEVATVYKNVGDGIDSIDQASESIISTMKAFKIEASDAMMIIDKFNIIGNKFAISSTGIGEALLNSASALYAAGNSLDESIAMVTAANEVIQDPDRVGTAMKTLSMYIRAAKTEAEEAGVSTEGMAESVSSLREEILQLTNRRVDIMLNDDTFKSTVQILRELSGIWGELSDVTRANITELIGGGVRNANVVATLINNFSTVEEVLKESANSAGSAMRENEKYLDSIAGKVAEFKNAFQRLSTVLLSSGTVKDIVSVGTGLLNIMRRLAKINEAMGGFHSTMVLIAGTISVIKMDRIIAMLTTLPAKLKVLKESIMGLGLLLGNIPKAIAAYVSGVGAGASKTKAFSAALSQLGLTAGVAKLGVAALTAAIVAGIAIYKAYKRHQQEARDRAIDEARAAEEAGNKIFELASKEAILAKAVEDGNAARDGLVAAQIEVNQALRNEGIHVDELAGKYDSMTQSIQANTLEALRNKQIALAGGLNAARGTLLDAGKPGFYDAEGINLIPVLWDQENEGKVATNQAAMDAMIKAGWIKGGNPGELKPYGAGGANIFLPVGEDGKYDLHTIDGIINAHERLFSVMETLRGTVGTDNEVFQALFNEYNKLTPTVNAYKDAVDALNKNLIQQVYIQNMDRSPTEGLPKTQEEFDKFLNWFTITVTNAATIGNSAFAGMFAGTEEDIKRAINLFLSSQPAFARFMTGITDSAGAVGGAVEGTKEKVDDFLKVVTDLKSAYDLLHRAEKEMAETGAISASTLLSIMDSTEDYIKYIEVENGLIKLNSEAWKENAEAKILAMIAEDEARRARLQAALTMPPDVPGSLVTNSTPRGDEEDEADPNHYSSIPALKELKEELNALNLTIETRKAILDALRKDGTDDSSSAIDDQLKKMDDALRKQIAFIEHQILILEKTGGSKEAIIKKYKELQDLVHNQAEIYRGMGLGEDSEYIINLQKLWLGYADNISGVRDAILADIKAIAEATDKAIDDIQAMYNTLQKAADEYAESGGHISIDTFQEIIRMGPQYMQYLQDENGLLVINRDKINDVIRAKTEQLSVETALAYVDRLRLAINGESTESLEHLLYATTQTTDATWGLVYASLDFLDLSDRQREAAKHNIDAIRSVTESALRGIGTVTGESANSMKEMRSGSEDLLKYVMDMLKDRIEGQIDAIEEEKDSYRELINLKKEALDTAKEEDDYDKNIAKQVKEIAKLQARIDLLSLDDSRDAQAERKRLQEEMQGLQESLADDQAKHAIDSQKDALDQMADDYDEEKDKEIEVLKDSISSKQKLYEMAIQYIRNNWNSLKNDLLQWNYDIGASFAEEIVSAWNKAMAAAQKYGSYLEALKQLQIGPFGGEGGGNGTIGGSGGGPNSIVGETTDEEHIHAIIREMYANSQSWLVADRNKDSDAKARLDKRNLELGAMLSRYGVHAVRGFKGKDDGVWFVDDIGGDKLYEKYRRYIYHTGGVAGDKPTLKQNEVMAVLERGEAVLDKRKEVALYKLVDFVSHLAGKIGSVVQSADMAQIFRGMAGSIPVGLPNVPIANVGNIHFGDVNIYGPNDETAKRHIEINRKFTNDVLRQLNIKR